MAIVYEWPLYTAQPRRGAHPRLGGDIVEIDRLFAQLSSHPPHVDAPYLFHVNRHGPGVHMAVAVDRDRPRADEFFTIVGMAWLIMVNLPRGFIGYVEDVVVDEAYRGRGIGRGLMEAIIARAKTFKLGRIDLTSRPDREAANALYSKLGFELRKTNCYRLAWPQKSGEA